MPHDSRGTLVFWSKDNGEIQTGLPHTGKATNASGLG